MATEKQKAAARRNIKKAQAALRGGSRRSRGGSMLRRLGRRTPKTYSLSKGLLLAGAATLVSDRAAQVASAATAKAAGAAGQAGYTGAVTGTTIILGALAAKAAAALVPSFGRKANAFLKSYGLRL